MANFLKSLLAKNGKSTPQADEAVETAKLASEVRVARMLQHDNQNNAHAKTVELPPLAG